MPELISALNHPLRRRILRAFLDGEFEQASSTQLATAIGLPLGNVAYHVKTLSKLGLLRLSRREKVRGAEERFYVLSLAEQTDCVRSVLESCRAADDAAQL
ncbi:MAG TPA: helix-turn-helix domain-containing protein [Solirubrobacterales bacterium]|nr:helix-turn-helix domain-containing protein [Solirubrobacterales bacterium]